jgi:hypothetical protein
MLSWSKERKGDSAVGDPSQSMDFVENTKNKHFLLSLRMIIRKSVLHIGVYRCWMKML